MTRTSKRLAMRFKSIHDVSCDAPPYRLSGTVYGVLLNHKSALAALGDAVNEAPYKSAPRAPILYLKPRNTFSFDGDIIAMPSKITELQIGASLGVVIGRTACRVSPEMSLSYVAGYLVVNDICIAHTSYFRPSVALRARDGFCSLGPRVVASGEIENPDNLRVRVHVDGVLTQTTSTADSIRSVAQLIADVSEFMTLAPGDVITTGAAAPATYARAGQTITIEIDGLGSLTNSFGTPS
jgi:5-oxopent-3-ene-1,2,5-tricarboxylate decarboxylase / 2-hydroxyhepta-2,4-diene-1,7-dioate isomerase